MNQENKTLNLVFKASSIAKAERKHGLKFFDAMTNIGGFSEIFFFLEAGGASEEDADEFVAKHGIPETMAAIVEAISESGFLGDLEIDMKELRQEMSKSVKQAASQITGETSKD